MRNGAILVVSIIAVLLIINVSQATVEIDWVTVGDARNVADDTGYGSVNYEYRIGKYEIINAQYCEFLNAVASNEDAYGLYDSSQMPFGLYGGIERVDSTYIVRSGQGNKPVNWIDFYDSLRFANWMHNGQPTGGQNSATTEDGAYDMSLGSDVVRKAGAKVWLTSEDEWYKAAYYKGGGLNMGYWEFATQSDTVPIAEAPPGGNNSANYLQWSDVIPTDVGAYASSVSAYGTFDQAGNAQEWNEGIIDSWKVIRGGSWGSWENRLAASFRTSYPATEGHDTIGFRIASIPEPSTLTLLVFSTIILRRKY